MKTAAAPSTRGSIENGQHIWWSNAILFVGIHVAALAGTYLYPFQSTPRATLVLAIILWQIACFSVTIGYHRLYSHRSFEAGLKTRAALALLGASAFQGSIKWWVLRHRLHHRFTDDPVHDPYAATRGLLWSHMGWIFFKQHYGRMNRVDKEDLEDDPVVRFQHKFYVPLAISMAFLVPVLLGHLWNDSAGAFVWGGLVVRIAVWHCTFLVNSLAHWDGLQPYSDENTSRVNLLVALLTCGEGNHNFHTFPQDFRSGPSSLDWDPSKWTILLLYRLGLVTSLRRARDEDLSDAQWRMHLKKHAVVCDLEERNAPIPVMTVSEMYEYVESNGERCVIIIGGVVVDVTVYLDEHPGGNALLRKYSIKPSPDQRVDKSHAAVAKILHEKATAAFHGGMNNHSRIAQEKLYELGIAQLQSY